MLIVCPSCATSYELGAGLIGNGRTVRCARCATAWFATVPEPAPLPAMAGADDVMPDLAGPASPAGLPQVPHGEAEGVALEDDIGWGLEAQSIADAELPPSTEAPMLDAPPLAPAGPGEPGTTAADDPAPPQAENIGDDIETIAARRTRLAAERRRRRRLSFLPVLLAVLVAVTAALLAARERVVRVAPQTASLYAALGLPVNLRGLAFENIRTAEEIEAGVPFLVVRGTVANVAGRAVEVPRLRFSARNAEGVEVYAWTALAGRETLGSGEALPFVSRLASPPPDTADVAVRFFHRRDLDSGR